MDKKVDREVTVTKREEIYKKAIQKYGKELQIDVAIEEMAELTKELVKDIRGKGIINHIIEEMADVHIMLEQLTIIYDVNSDVFNDYVTGKVERLQRRLND